jgi:hypothetical protein
LASDIADRFLKENGVTISYKKPYDEIEASKGFDLVIKCMGYTFDHSYLRKNFENCLTREGMIKVNSFMQLTAGDPIAETNLVPIKENIYACGDNS